MEEKVYRREGKYIISAIIFIVSVILFLTLCHDQILLQTTHQHRMNLIKEKDSLYQLDKNLYFDKASMKYNKFLDSMRVVVYRDLQK